MTQLIVMSHNFVNTPKSGPYNWGGKDKLFFFIKQKFCNVNIHKEGDGCTDKTVLQIYSDFSLCLYRKLQSVNHELKSSSHEIF